MPPLKMEDLQNTRSKGPLPARTLLLASIWETSVTHTLSRTLIMRRYLSIRPPVRTRAIVPGGRHHGRDVVILIDEYDAPGEAVL